MRLSTPVSGTDIGPATHVLYQDFTVPVAISAATLRFQMFVGDPNNLGFAVAGDASPAQLLNYNVSGDNQFGRVDLLRSTAGVFSTASDRCDSQFLFQCG